MGTHGGGGAVVIYSLPREWRMQAGCKRRNEFAGEIEYREKKCKGREFQKKDSYDALSVTCDFHVTSPQPSESFLED